MSDRPESIPAPFDDDAPLRETYAHQVRPEDRQTLGHLCRSLLELIREASVISRHIQSGSLLDSLAAAAADLRFLETYLRHVGGDEDEPMERRQFRLAHQAEQLAAHIGDLADEIEVAVAAAE